MPLLEPQYPNEQTNGSPHERDWTFNKPPATKAPTSSEPAAPTPAPENLWNHSLTSMAEPDGGSQTPGFTGAPNTTPPVGGNMQITTVKQPNAPTPAQATSANYQPTQGTAQGYLSQASQASGYEGAQGASANYNADQREVGANSTVKHQMEGLLSEGSKYLDLARSKAAEQANSRGFLNSTMAAGAGERAAIESALPIAQQDAYTHNNQSLTNQNAVNTERQFNAGNDQQMTLANMQSQNQANQFTAGQEQQNSQFNAASANEASQFTAQQKNAMEQFNAASANEAGQFNATADMNTSQFNTTQTNNMLQNQWSQLSAQAHEQVMKNLDTSSRQILIDFEKKWDRLIEHDRAANTAYSMAMQSLGTAMSNGELSTEQQKYAAQQIAGQLESYMNLLNKLRG